MACSQRGILQQRKTSQQHAVDSVVLQSQCAETGRLVGTQDESMAPNTGKHWMGTWFKPPAISDSLRPCSNMMTNRNLQLTYNWKGFRCETWKSLTCPAKAHRWKTKKKNPKNALKKTDQRPPSQNCWRVSNHGLKISYCTLFKNRKPRRWNTRHFLHTSRSTKLHWNNVFQSVT